MRHREPLRRSSVPIRFRVKREPRGERFETVEASEVPDGEEREPDHGSTVTMTALTGDQITLACLAPILTAQISPFISRLTPP